MSERSLIVYFTRTGNTRYIACAITAFTGARMLELQTVDTYPTDYYECVEQSKVEIGSGYCPPLKEYELDLEDYDTVFVGSPIWCGTYAPAVNTFFMEHDLSGKVIVPFCTHGGGGQKNFTAHIRDVCRECDVRETLVLFDDGEPGLVDQVRRWLARCRLN